MQQIFTLFQSRNLVYPDSNFEMYSFVIKIAIDFNKAVLLVNTKPMLGFSIDDVEVVIAERDPNNTSVIIINIFFLFKLLSFSYIDHYQF